MSSKTWIYVIILIIVLAAGGIFFWWMYKGGKVTPKAAESPKPAVVTQSFEDVPPNYWAFKEIEGVNEKGYMFGWMYFQPDGNVTRGVLAAAVGKAYDKIASPATPSFTDVPATDVNYQWIEGLKAAGWMEGYPDGTFKPGNTADRATIVVAISRAFANGDSNVILPPSPVVFPDVPDTHWAYKYIEYAADKGLVYGYSDGTFRPDQTAIRSDLAIILARAKAGSDDAVPVPTTRTFIDILPDNAAYKYIEYVFNNANKAMSGIFRPDDFADRAVVAVVMARADAGSEAAIPAGPATPTFSDVPTTHWAYKHIEYVNSKGIMTGNGDGTFRPDAQTEYAKRFTIAVAIARAKGLLNNFTPPTTPSFVDVPTTHQFFAEIESLKAAGLINGCREETNPSPPPDKLYYFCPDDNLTRATVAVFIYRAYVQTPVVTQHYICSATKTCVLTDGAGTDACKTDADCQATPTPGVTPTPTTTLATPTPTTSVTSPGTGAGTGTGTGTLLGALLLFRYLAGRKIK
ncbi:MAG: hypothetical protein HW405_467 [Candidatus Berkelbacteria bacterium]|nr:hypothetical protein [Candidatus Berkelbacteria bacterium]